MSNRIEDYALIGNTHTAALVGRDGSIDWLCMPRFDAGACFAALLGTAENGRWLIAPAAQAKTVRRKYRGDTLVLETEFELADGGRVAIIDFMPICERDGQIDLIRIVEGRGGVVPMQLETVFRFDYGRIVPWVRSREYGISAVAGPDALQLRTPVAMHGENLKTVADFAVKEGERIPFTLTWYPSHLEESPARDPLELLENTEKYWCEWSARCHDGGEWRPYVIRSLITLKALTYSPTGGIVAAPTTSLPEWIGSVRNWDYRYCWLRDATFTLYALLSSGYSDEAAAWREWLLRAIAGQPDQIQIMYGIAGERRLTEFEAPWLPGYEGSSPVRIGNAAHDQFQLDVYGEILDVFHTARRYNLSPSDDAWNVILVMMDFVEKHWRDPDEGIWEVRGPRRHFTHSKVMAWVAVDRAVKAVERYGRKGPVDKWRVLRDTIHADVCANGFNAQRNAFVQFYGTDRLDASLLMMTLVGFLPAHDPRVIGTVEAIQRDLMDEALVRRYATDDPGVDGLPPGEGAFLPCTFWLVDNLAMMGRYDEARAIFERLIGLCNDVGLLSEEYDPRGKRQLGNFPQAFAHVFLINTAHNLSRVEGPAKVRAKT